MIFQKRPHFSSKRNVLGLCIVSSIKARKIRAIWSLKATSFGGDMLKMHSRTGKFMSTSYVRVLQTCRRFPFVNSPSVFWGVDCPLYGWVVLCSPSGLRLRLGQPRSFPPDHCEGARLYIIRRPASYRSYLCCGVRHIRHRLVLLGPPPSAIPVYLRRPVCRIGWLHHLYCRLEPGGSRRGLRGHFHCDMRVVSRGRGNGLVAFK